MDPEPVHPLLEALPLAAVLIGRDERIQGANAGARALLGAGIAGRHFITALRQPGVLDAVETCLASGAPQRVSYLGTEAGQGTTYSVTIGPAGALGVLVSFEDVTSLAQAGQMRRDFVANVSHELRTPLTALMGFIETLRGPARGDAQATDRFLQTMQVEAVRMERLVHDLLSLSRVEAQERMRPTERVDVTALLGGVVHGLQPVAKAATVTIASTLPESAITMPGDGDQLRQVFVNLIENAIKYGGADTTVQVTLERVANEPNLRRDGVVIRVRDQGPGIDPAHIPRLTERFYRVDSHRSRQMGGTGLGLAIVKHIISRHRGRLRITSTLGKGSEFKVILPISHE